MRQRRIDLLGDLHTDPTRTDGVFARLDKKTGFLRARVKLTRTGVFQYGDKDGNRWGELRTEDEVFKDTAVESFKLSIVTDDHPAEFVTTENVEDLQVGHIGSEVKRDGDFLVADILITNKNVIDKVLDGKVEVSCGYWATVLADSGVSEDGETYKGRHTDIEGNHVAIVERGRAGRECRLYLDGQAAIARVDTLKTATVPPTPGQAPERHTTMKLETKNGVLVLVVDGKDLPVPSEILDSLRQDSDLLAENEQLREQAAEAAKADAQNEILKARIDALEIGQTQVPQLVSARVELERNAGRVLDTDDFSGKSDAEVKAAVIASVFPALAEKLTDATPTYIGGLFDAALEHFGVSQVAELASLGLAPAIAAKTNDADAELDKLFNEAQA